MLTLLATAYGVGAAGAALFQTRQLLESRRSCEVSARFFAVYAGGYAVWLAYGVSIGSVPLIVVDAIGVVCATATLAIALSLRGSLLDPSTWNSCPTSRAALPRRAAPTSSGVALAVAALDLLPAPGPESLSPVTRELEQAPA
jgi:uncharacterized protein with PQ loop repeat